MELEWRIIVNFSKAYLRSIAEYQLLQFEDC